MSRASELTLLIILLQASIGFVDASGMFTTHYLATSDNNASYTLTDLKEYTSASSGTSSIIDQASLAVSWMADSFLIGLKVVLAVVFVLPTIRDAFGIDLVLAGFIQVGIYYIYATWYTQYRSGRGWKQYE